MYDSSEKPSSFSIQEAMRIASTPQGQQLIAALKKNSGNDLENALRKAQTGDYTEARKAITSLMDTPEIKALLKQLGR